MALRRADRVRAKTALQVGFVGTEDRFTAPLREFTPYGLSVTTKREVRIGTIFRLGIKMDADYFRAAAVVRAQLPGGFAVEFLSMNAMDRELMRRLYLRVQMAGREPAAG
jgi:hypothetical protein